MERFEYFFKFCLSSILIAFGFFWGFIALRNYLSKLEKNENIAGSVYEQEKYFNLLQKEIDLTLNQSKNLTPTFSSEYLNLAEDTSYFQVRLTTGIQIIKVVKDKFSTLFEINQKPEIVKLLSNESIIFAIKDLVTYETSIFYKDKTKTLKLYTISNDLEIVDVGLEYKTPTVYIITKDIYKDAYFFSYLGFENTNEKLLNKVFLDDRPSFLQITQNKIVYQTGEKCFEIEFSQNKSKEVDCTIVIKNPSKVNIFKNYNEIKFFDLGVTPILSKSLSLKLDDYTEFFYYGGNLIGLDNKLNIFNLFKIPESSTILNVPDKQILGTTDLTFESISETNDRYYIVLKKDDKYSLFYLLKQVKKDVDGKVIPNQFLEIDLGLESEIWEMNFIDFLPRISL